MDFALGAEQEEFRHSAQRFLADRVRVRELLARPGAHDPDLWTAMAGLGWMGVAMPEEHGGQGLGFVDFCVLLEATGAALLPGPFLSTAALAVAALQECGSPDQQKRFLSEIAGGRAIVAAAFLPGLRLARGRLAGEIAPVADAAVATWLVALADTSEGPAFFLLARDDVEVEPVEPVDLTRPAARVRARRGRFEERLPGQRIEAALARARVALSAEMTGGAARCLETAVSYARDRRQFERPIGSFQAVKHRAADMLRAVEGARLATYAAACAVDAGDARVDLAAAIAKAAASDAFVGCAAGSIQIHGGVGFTWEHDAHLYYRRALSSAALLGNAAEHRERVARALLEAR